MRCSFRFRSERLQEALADPARVARAVPGLQQDAGAEPVAGRLKVRVGSHSITYRGARPRHPAGRRFVRRRGRRHRGPRQRLGEARPHAPRSRRRTAAPGSPSTARRAATAGHGAAGRSGRLGGDPAAEPFRGEPGGAAPSRRRRRSDRPDVRARGDRDFDDAERRPPRPADPGDLLDDEAEVPTRSPRDDEVAEDRRRRAGPRRRTTAVADVATSGEPARRGRARPPHDDRPQRGGGRPRAAPRPVRPGPRPADRRRRRHPALGGPGGGPGRSPRRSWSAGRCASAAETAGRGARRLTPQ